MSRKKEATGGKGGVREKIMGVALKVLQENGILRVAQPHIAKISGVPQGHITYYFPKRSDLILALEEESMASLGRFMASKLGKSTAKKSMKIVLAAISHLLKDRARAMALLGLLVESEENPELKERLKARCRFGEGVVAQLLNWEQDDPEVRQVHATLIGLDIYHFLFEDASSSAAIDAYVSQLAKRRQPEKS